MYPAIMSARTLLTLEDVLALPDRDDCRYELDEGELVEMTLPRPRHQIAVARLLFQLETYIRMNPVGLILPSDTPFLLRRDPDVLRGPDIAFIRTERAAGIDLDKVIEGAPTLAIEVASPSDRITALLKKVFQYLEAGAAEVWLVLPEPREVHIYTQTESPRIVREPDDLTSKTLPGFVFSAGSIFA
jgi:Uma2 family endonuclease